MTGAAHDPAATSGDGSGRGALGRGHASLAQRVADALRDAILARRYRPGERLVEDRLSEELGVSRIPIREALRALAAEGLVRVEPRRGASVAEVSPQLAGDLVEVRATLEGLNARLAAVIDGDEELAAMLATRHVRRAADAALAALAEPPAAP
jgi:DNA-binding GntR family transcriptional regulator